MSKKVSLKDAFVRNAGAVEPGGVHSHGSTRAQLSSDTAIQLDSNPAPHSIAATVEAVAPGPSSQATYQEPVTQPAVSLYNQRATSAATSSTPLKKKATFNLNAALHQRLKIAAAIHSREMVDIVEDALQTYLPRLDQKAR